MLSPIRDLHLDQIYVYVEEICLRFGGQYPTVAGHVVGLSDVLPVDKNINCWQRPADAQMIAHYALQSLSLPQHYPVLTEPISWLPPNLVQQNSGFNMTDHTFHYDPH